LCGGALPPHLQQRERDGEHHRAEEEAHGPEDDDAADQGHQQRDRVQSQVPADDDGVKHVVGQADDRRTPEHHDDRLSPLTVEQQEERGRQPDQRRAEQRNDGQESHHDRPEPRGGQVEPPEHEAAEQALNDAHHDLPADRREDRVASGTKNAIRFGGRHRQHGANARKHGVAIPEKEEEEEERQRELDEADEALDKSDYGNALHRILKTFHDSNPPLECDAALAQLNTLSTAEFAALPAYTAAAWASQWNKIQPAYIDAWLAHASQGWRYESGETDFSMPHTVEGLGEITLHGRVDRVDQKSDARTVIDYKTGSAQGLKKKLKDPTEAVQLPFYAWLAEAAAAYLPINETPVAPLELDGETDVDAISRRLPKLLEAIAAGAALPASGIDAACQYCEARGLCRKGMWT